MVHLPGMGAVTDGPRRPGLATLPEMRARDVLEQVPTVTPADRVASAVRLMADSGLPGLVVVRDGRPLAVLPGTQVLLLTVPRALLEGGTTVRTVDESHADLFWRELGDLTVGDCLPRRPDRPAVVAPDATVLEIATVMARSRSPLVAVVDPELVGAITLTALLRVLSAA
jgi:CBS domain-containing protein